MIKKKILKNHGFTLVELLAVVGILLTISVIAVASISAVMERNNSKKDDATKEVIVSYAKLYADEFEVSFSGCVNVSTLKDYYYLDEDTIKDSNGNVFNGSVSRCNGKYEYYAGDCSMNSTFINCEEEEEDVVVPNPEPTPEPEPEPEPDSDSDSEDTVTLLYTATTGSCNSLTYNGQSQTLVSGGAYVNYVNNTGTAAGSYTVTINAKTGYAFSDGTTTKTKTCTIASVSSGGSSGGSGGGTTTPVEYATTGSCTNPSYYGDGKEKILMNGGTYVNYVNNKAVEVGEYTVTINAKTGYTFSDGTTTKTQVCKILAFVKYQLLVSTSKGVKSVYVNGVNKGKGTYVQVMSNTSGIISVYGVPEDGYTMTSCSQSDPCTFSYSMPYSMGTENPKIIPTATAN